MEVNYTNSREDIINFHMRHYKETKGYRILIRNNLLYAIVVSLCILLMVLILTGTCTKGILPLIIADPIFILFIKKYSNSIYNKTLNAIYNYQGNNSYFYQTKLTTSEDYLNLSTDLDRKSYKWKSIHGVYLIDNYIFITTTAHDDILIPLSCFNSPQETNSFLSTILKSSNSELKRSYPVDIRYR